MDVDNQQYYKINKTTICCCIPYDDYIKVDYSDIFIKKDQELNDIRQEKNTIERNLKQYQAYVEQQNKELMTKTSAIINEQAKELEAIKQKFNDINNRNQVITNDHLAKISQLKEDNSKLLQENTKLKEINESLQNENLQYKTKIGEDEKLQKEIDEKQNIQESSNKEIDKLQEQKQKTQKELDEINKKTQELENLKEEKILDMNVDGTDITWRKVLNITNKIVSMRINYLRKMRRKLKDIGRKYNKANAVQKNDMSKDFDVIAWNGKIIKDKSDITQDVVDAYNKAIEKPSWNGQPTLEIYDEDQRKVVFKKEYNLGKMNDYKVALYIPK